MQLLRLYAYIGREWGGAAHRLQAEERGASSLRAVYDFKYVSVFNLCMWICLYVRVVYALAVSIHAFLV